MQIQPLHRFASTSRGNSSIFQSTAKSKVQQIIGFWTLTIQHEHDGRIDDDGQHCQQIGNRTEEQSGEDNAQQERCFYTGEDVYEKEHKRRSPAK